MTLGYSRESAKGRTAGEVRRYPTRRFQNLESSVLSVRSDQELQSLRLSDKFASDNLAGCNGWEDMKELLVSFVIPTRGHCGTVIGERA
jgi:hypothetical protein